MERKGPRPRTARGSAPRNPWTYPANDVVAGVWVHLQVRYRRPRLALRQRNVLKQSIRRLAREGVDVRALHDAMLAGMHTYWAHQRGNASREHARRLAERRDRAVRDLSRAAESLRALCADVVEVNALRALAEEVAKFPPGADLPVRRTAPGRPWPGRAPADAALKRLGVPYEERQQILAALGLTKIAE